MRIKGNKKNRGRQNAAPTSGFSPMFVGEAFCRPQLSKQFRAVCILLLSAFILISAASCAKKAPPVRDDVSVDDLEAAVAVLFDADSLAAVDANYVSRRVGIEQDAIEAFVMKITQIGVNVDEYGIFSAVSEDAALNISAAVDEYLQSLRDSWLDECQDPEQKPKVTNAASTSIGRYVMYVIADDDIQTKAFDAFEKVLKK